MINDVEPFSDVLLQWVNNIRETHANLSDDELKILLTRALSVQPTVVQAVPVPSTAVVAPAPTLAVTPTPPVRTSSKPIRAYIDGCFDIMHSGHYNAIRQAKQLTDVLVVGVHSDAEILRCKGPPVMNEDERLATVKACKWVDEVVFDTPYDPSIELLDRLNCDFCVHGDDTSTTPDGDDAYSVVRRAGRLRVIKRTEGVSTTDLVGRLLLMTKRHHLTDSAASSPVIQGMTGDLPSLSPLPLSPPMSVSGNLKRAADDLAKRDSFSHRVSLETNGSAAEMKLDVPPTAVNDRTMSAFLPTAWRISQFSSGRVPSKDDKVVYIDGAFDLFHIGHIDTLRKARQFGTFLYVGLHDDHTVNAHKGKNYPIMNLHERVLNVLSCKYVDEVVMGAPWTVTQDLMNSLNIMVVASGTDTKLMSANMDTPDPYALPKRLGKFQWVETSRNLNTDMVVQRIIDNRIKYVKRNKTRTKKEENYYNKQKEYVAEI